jgi:thiaminase
MQMISSTEQDQQLWQQFVNQANAYAQSRQVFFQQCKDRIKIIREALHHPSQRRVALLFFEYLNETECEINNGTWIPQDIQCVKAPCPQGYCDLYTECYDKLRESEDIYNRNVFFILFIKCLS